MVLNRRCCQHQCPFICDMNMLYLFSYLYFIFICFLSPIWHLFLFRHLYTHTQIHIMSHHYHYYYLGLCLCHSSFYFSLIYMQYTWFLLLLPFCIKYYYHSYSFSNLHLTYLINIYTIMMCNISYHVYVKVNKWQHLSWKSFAWYIIYYELLYLTVTNSADFAHFPLKEMVEKWTILVI